MVAREAFSLKLVDIDMRTKLFVGCMPFRFTADDLRKELTPYGKVVTLNWHQDLEHATFDSYAHVEVESDDVQRLICDLDGKHIGNRVLRVNELVPRTDDLHLV